MVVRICLSVLQLTAAICIDCDAFSSQTDRGIQGTEISESVVGQEVAPAEELAERDLPYFPIESNLLATRRKIESLPCNPNRSNNADDCDSPHEDALMVTFGSTTKGRGTIPETCLFRHVDYSVLTPEYAFSPDTPSPYLKFQAADSLTSGNRADSAQFTRIAQAAPTSGEMRDDKTLPDSTSGVDYSLDRIMNRPLSAISLGAAMTPVTSSGEPLQTPQSVVEMQGSRIVQRQYVAGPFCFTHPSRNSFRFRHQPLYFEDPNMERCGISNGCLTEFASICHFGTRIPLLPYLMASNSPHECVRALPDCPTCCRFGPEACIPQPTAKAVAAQAAATVGFIFLIP